MILSEIVTDICERAGISASDIDVTELTDEVIGYKIPRQMPARTALETLMSTFNFDAAEVDWKLIFKKRGSASSATITATDLRAHMAGDKFPDRAVETRTQDLDLPTHLTLSYESIARDYEIATQNAVRVDKSTFLPRTASVGVVLSDSYAKQQAEILLKELWKGRHRYAFATTMKHLKRAPGDVVTVVGKDMRVIEMSDRDGIIEFQCESEDTGVYTSAAVADDLTITVPNMATDTYVPSFVYMDLPPLSEDFGSAGLYFALYGTDPEFTGGTIQRSTDGGANYMDVGFVGSTRAKVGTCSGTFGNGVENCLDYTASLTVDLSISESTLASVTDDQLTTGSNLAAIGLAGSWEIVQFKTATLVSGNTYTLTGFLRGLYGTSRFMSTHTSGEYFVQLNSLTGIDFVGALTEAIGVDYLYRVMNSSGNVGTAIPCTTGGLALECFPAQAAYGGFNSSGDFILNWSRGDRYEFVTADLPDGGDIPMEELSEAYEVDVIHPSLYTVLRTLTSSTPTVTYTAAQQSTDSYPAGPITFDIYQLSGVIGRGIVKRVTI